MRFTILPLALLTGCASIMTTSSEDDYLNKFDMRAGVGYASRINEDFDSQLAVEAQVTARFGLRDEEIGTWTPTLMPEFGYVGQMGDHNDHFLNLGIGYGFTYDQIFTAGIVPGLLVGTMHTPHAAEIRTLGVGGRMMVVMEVIHAIGVQFSYDALWTETGLAHDLRVTGSLNLIPVLIALYVAGQ